MTRTTPRSGRRAAVLIGLLALLVPASAAVAGTSYRFSVTTEGHSLESDVSGRVVVDGAKLRIELDPSDGPRPFDLLVSEDGGATATALNSELRTFYRAEPGSFMVVQGHFPLRFGEPSLHDLKVEVLEEGSAEVIAGHPTRKATVTLSFQERMRHHGETLRMDVRVVAESWRADLELPLPTRLLPVLGTSQPKVGELLHATQAEHSGVPLKQRLSATRTFVGETPATEVKTLVISDIRPASPTPQDFAVPQGWTHQEPVISKPGFSGGGSPPQR